MLSSGKKVRKCKMRKIIGHFGIGYSGCEYEEEFEFDDDADNGEIYDQLFE